MKKRKMNDESYRIMRLFVLFDMPVEKEAQRKEYSKFRKFLLQDGFVMLQYSVYTRFCTNDTDAKKHIKRILGFKPKYGNIRILKITENQFNNMIMVAGERSEQELAENEEQLLII